MDLSVSIVNKRFTLKPASGRIVRPRASISPNFRLRSSTSVLLKVESILYPQSYCSLDLTQIHSFFTEEDCFDWFGTPHYPALFHAAAAHCPLDYRSRGW